MPTLIETNPEAPFPLGRAAAEDDIRNWQHRALVSPPPMIKKGYRIWFSPDIYDQKTSPQCTTEASVGLLRTSPFRAQFRLDWPKFDTYAERRAFYLLCQKYDPPEWGAHDGSLVSSPLKEMKRLGMISGYRWLFGEEELREWVTWFGPAKVGIGWTHGMFFPDSNGYIHPTGSDQGGHDIRVYYFSQQRQAYRLANSWGREWGENGRAWITAEAMDDRLRNWGEAVTIAR
jgi:hypothetical protein